MRNSTSTNKTLSEVDWVTTSPVRKNGKSLIIMMKALSVDANLRPARALSPAAKIVNRTRRFAGFYVPKIVEGQEATSKTMWTSAIGCPELAVAREKRTHIRTTERMVLTTESRTSPTVLCS